MLININIVEGLKTTLDHEEMKSGNLKEERESYGVSNACPKSLPSLT